MKGEKNMEELFPVNMTITELNIIHNIIGVIMCKGKYERGNWNSETVKDVSNLVEKVGKIQKDAYKKINSCI